MTIIIWKCRLCKDIQVSNSKKHHCMDVCSCGCGVDLEEYGCRIAFKNSPKDIVELKRIEHSQFDIWQELILGTVEQVLHGQWGLCYIPFDMILKLNKIEKEVYLSFIK